MLRHPGLVGQYNKQGLILPNMGWFADLLTGTVPYGMSFTRASAAGMVNSAGVWVDNVATDTPRFATDPLTLKPRGLMVEGPRTNTFKKPRTFNDGAVWQNPGRVTWTANQGIGYDGLNSLWKMAGLNATGSYVYQSSISGAAGTHTESHIFKAGSTPWVNIFIGGGVNATAWFDLQNKTVGTISGSATTKYAEIFDRGNGFVECVFTASVSLTNQACGFGISDADNTQNITVGNYIYVWDAQLELQSYGASSRILTDTTAVTRAYDMPIIDLAAIGFNHAEGTVIFEYELINNPRWNFQELHSFVNNAETQYMATLYPNGDSSQIRSVNTTGTPFDIYSQTGVRTVGRIHKHGFTYKNNNTAICVDGGAIGYDTSCLMIGSGLTKWLLGMGNTAGANSGNLYIRKIQYLPFRLPDAQFQSATVV